MRSCVQVHLSWPAEPKHNGGTPLGDCEWLVRNAATC